MSNKAESLRNIKGIGEKTEKLFEKVGVSTCSQLLHYYPRDYDFYEPAVSIGSVKENQKNAVAAVVASPPVQRGTGSKTVTILNIQDETGRMEIVWFHMPFLRATLKRGMRFIFRGNVVRKGNRLSMEHPEIFSFAEYEEKAGKPQPIYSLTAGLSNKTVIKSVQNLLGEISLAGDYMPDEVRRRYSLCDWNYAIASIHFPDTKEGLLLARTRLVFDEFFFFLLALHFLKGKGVQEENHFPMRMVWKTEEIMDRLPYRLTKGQLSVWNDMEKDLSGGILMNRLIQGDVGSGKTILAFLGMIMAYENGYQSAIMVPTEVLAAQHYQSLLDLLYQNDIADAEPVLLTGSCTAAEKKKIYEKISSGKTKMIIGTHALIQEKVIYHKLALVITDEQHRFGVRQRMMLSEKGYPPNVLVMSATPIPRTLAIILYGDLSISVLKDMPARRKPIKNCVVNTSYRPNAYRFMDREIKAGHQVYIICPMVDKNEELDLENVTEYAEKIRREFPPTVKIGILHGQMKPREKDLVMREFAANQIQILVSTTVIEVGINVPNATVMMIENAERFGLAQLHQLRGRVGRGEDQSYCIFMQGSDGETISKRLEILGHSNDGFRIAAEDLKLRGPGDLFGIRQSGLASFRIADIYQDADILQYAQDAAADVYQMDPNLILPQNRLLKAALDRYMERQIEEIGL